MTLPSPRVLLVDDQSGMRTALRNLLQDEGIMVVGEAADGEEGVARARALSPDVVLMDLRMPRLNGIQATREIKRLLPLTQVVIFTAYDDLGIQRNAAEVGVHAYLVKGCPPQVILSTVIDAWKGPAGRPHEFPVS
ncbi:MAG TPA: response regulator transcription factor [Actinomycetes bacterium]|nr:response regulator transcription factor [Actinomycetes bacterium]